jgi:hypothetical protein
MLDVLIYLFKTLFFRITMFFKRWYWGGFFAVYGQALRFARAVSSSFDPRLNALFLFKPLYQEYNIVGYILGFVVRGAKLCIGSILYVVVFAIALVVYVFWAFVPITIVYKIIQGA